MRQKLLRLLIVLIVAGAFVWSLNSSLDSIQSYQVPEEPLSIFQPPKPGATLPVQ